MAALAIAAIGLGLAAKGMMDQRKAAKKAARAQREQNKAQTAQATIENRARRAKMIRSAQLARAQAENIQATQGGGGVTTSMATGALFTADTQQAVNLADFSEQSRQGGLYGAAQLQLGRATSLANRGTALMKLGGTLMTNADRIGGVFGGGSQAPAPVTDRSISGHNWGYHNYASH